MHIQCMKLFKIALVKEKRWPTGNNIFNTAITFIPFCNQNSCCISLGLNFKNTEKIAVSFTKHPRILQFPLKKTHIYI